MAQTLGITGALALLAALYFLAAGMAVATRPGMAREMMDALSGQPLICYLGGVMVFAVGAAMVAVHNIWSGPLAIVVTLVGWAALIEGLLLIALQGRFVEWFRGIPLSDGVARAFGIGTVALGAVLAVAALS